MDIPTDLLTNQYEIAGIDEVFWDFYEFTTFPDPQAQPGSVAWRLDRFRIESQLRNYGILVLLDCDNLGIWLFRLSKRSRTDLPRLISLFKLILTANGSIRIDHLLGGHAGDDSTGNLFIRERRSDSDTRLFKPPALDVQVSKPRPRPPSASHIYKNLVRAVCRSLAFSLAQQPGWILFADDTCLNERSIGFTTAFDPFTTELLSYTCRWTTTGTFMIHAVSRDVPKLHNVSELYPAPEIENSVDQIVLAFPLQAAGVIRGTFPSTKRAHESSMNFVHQKYTADCLEALNMPVKIGNSWVRVQLKEETISGLVDDDLPPLPHNGYEIVWPSKFCLCSTPQAILESLKGTLNPEIDIMDPIERAQSWFKDSMKRARAQEEMEEKAADIEDTRTSEESVDPISKEHLSPLGQRGLMDSSTVYPTPPDGIHSYTQNTPMPDQVFEGTEDKNSQAFKANARHPASVENPDLFGEHEMDLTEADFEFFDEPGFDETLTKSEKNKATEKAHNLEASLVLSEDPPWLKESESQAQTKSQGQQAHMIVESEAMKEYAPMVTPVSMFTIERSPSQTYDEDPHETDIGTAYDSLPGSCTSDSPFSQVIARFEGQAMELDTKYSITGPYGFVPASVPPVPHQVLDDRSTKQSIPHIGFGEGSESDTEPSDDPGMSSLYQDAAYPHSSTVGLMDADRTSTTWLEEDILKTSIVKESNIGQSPTTPASGVAEEKIHEQQAMNLLPEVSLVSLRPFLSRSRSAKQLFQGCANGPPIRAGGTDMIKLAQILIDQAITSSSYETPLRSLLRNAPEVQGPIGARHLPLASNIITQLLQPSGAKMLKHTMSTDVNMTLELQSDARNPMRLLDLPRVNLRRMNVQLSILPSAVLLWEELGLEPLHGQKNMLSVCVSTQTHAYLRRPMKKFLKQMRDSYQSCQLGRHDVIDNPDYYQDLVNREGFTKLGSALAEYENEDACLLVYLINGSGEPAPTAVSEACQQTMEGYRSGVDNDGPCDLVVQIVPQNMVYDSESPAIPAVDVLKRLALEVYDRCGPVNDSASFELAPAVALPQESPDKIGFQLTSDSASVNLFHDDCLHIAYAWSPRNEWMTVTWVDNTGHLQWNTGYFVGDVENPWQEFGSAVNEIIETTLLMTGPPGLLRRIFVLKQSKYLREELTMWQSVASNPGIKSRLTFHFLVVDPDPNLQLSPTQLELQPDEEPIDQPLTPASTPLAQGSSPEVSSAPTPGPSGFDHDMETRLIDARDDTWVFYPNTSVDDPFLPSSFCPSQESVYLLKRGGASEVDGFFLMAVSLVHTSDKGNTHLLEEVLEMYHKLGLLARLRGLTDASRGLLPLHMAAASKAYAAVTTSLRWEPE